ncbi:MAG: glycosyltransferase family 2 protein [Pyrinomonadaceae bacterium]|nr:glycosyltransferase family 2 protein [Pyrinomonadaceae bacterium]MCX7640848.1 glycosyltransferase family 2 protein [Pyrinomonadaceae bacterium]MDW8303387.1 glycosyltransferase family 2 protein [Acidobacteriota bacterium]
MIAEIIFFLSLLLLFYTYIGYPLLIFSIGRLFPKEVKKSKIEPKVTILMTAYNEEKNIRQKIQNTLQIDYPRQKLEIIVASDGSTDRTDDIVKEFSDQGVKLFRQEGRKGKTYTQNKAIEQASGEIILFSDATTLYPKNILRKLLPNFADESVGCVTGRLIYVSDPNSTIGDGTKSYWEYENFIKEAESRACSLVGASGCMYAVRRSAYEPMYPEACSDFLIASILYRRGLRSIIEPEAICFEKTNENFEDELNMRVRVVTQTLTDLWINRDMLNPFKTGLYAIELISHKVLRYMVPFFLISLFVSNALLITESLFFVFTFFLQLLFYLLALIARFLEKRKVKFLKQPLYFLLANLASLIGFYKFLKGDRIPNWETKR